MNDIRFLNQLGDNLEEAARRKSDGGGNRGPRGVRRALVIGLSFLVLAAGGIAVAGLLDDPDTLAANSIGCYESSDRAGDVAVVGSDGESPVRVCAGVREEMGLPRVPLVACSAGEAIAVVPGRSCAAEGMSEIPAGYAASVERIDDLARAIRREELSADCLPVDVLAARARRILEERGWDGWRVERTGPGGELPCGRITAADESSDGRTLAGSMNTERSILYVYGTPPR